MADTIVTNTPATQSDSGAAGWIVALIVLVAVIVAGIVLYQRGFLGGANQPQTPDTTNINVTVPNPTTPAPTTP